MALTTQIAPDEMAPRMCGCTFCRKHPAMWFADPAGKLELRLSNNVNRYQFGSKTADFVLCGTCGTVLAATCTIEGADYGILNLNCIDLSRDWPLPSAKSDFDGEGVGDRLARRARNWMALETSSAQ
ncbi:MAG: hypothetical protein AAF250_02030 [Pseudomonadota bacterium]